MAAPPPVSYMPAQTIVVTAPQALGHDPAQVFCPGCNSQIVSKVEYEKGTCTWLSCGLIFILGGPCFCCLIPFCIDTCKDAVHTCPTCGRSLGVFKRL
ncbi:hypothetical protein SprV_0301064400 [Sparganum proliferum]